MSLNTSFEMSKNNELNIDIHSYQKQMAKTVTAKTKSASFRVDYQ